MYWADEMVPKREKGQTANIRLARYIMLASLFHLSSYIPQRTQCMSLPVLSANLGILTLRRVIPELSRFSLCAEHIYYKCHIKVFAKVLMILR